MNNVESLKYFLPEIVLIAGIISLIFLTFFRKKDLSVYVYPITMIFLAVSLLITLFMHVPDNVSSLFMGMISTDQFGQFFKILILITAMIAALMSDKSRDLKTSPKIEFFAFLLAMTLGLMILVVSNNLLMIYLTIEISSIIAYLMSGYIAFDKKSEEASLKYVLYGGMASGMMIYGLSLLYGLTGSLNLVEMHTFFMNNATDRLVLFITFIFILAGLGYKMAIAPFHMWSPDVYEGAPVPVTAFLSVASKAGGFAITLRLFLVTFATKAEGASVWEPLKDLDWQTLISALAMITMTVGNLLALRQTNMKRFLAYSSVAHAGYLLMGLAAQSIQGLEAINFYFVTYLIMNLGAFLVVILVANQFETEQIDGYKGLARRSLYGLIISICLGIFMLSLAGIPPFAGFVGKWYLFKSLVDANLYTLAIVGVINSVISLYYYVKILKVTLIDSPESETAVQNSYLQFSVLIILFAGFTVYFGLFFEPIVKWAQNSVQFFQ